MRTTVVSGVKATGSICFEAIDATAKSRCGFYKTIYSIPRSIKPKFGSSACIVFAAGPSGELLDVFFSNCDGEG